MRILQTAIIAILICCTLPAIASAQERSGSIVTIDGVQYYVHTVAKNETIYGLSRLYNVSEDEIIVRNPHIGGNLKDGQVLKIPVNRTGEKQLNSRQLKRTFDVHTVIRGETLYGISRQYGISLNVLMEDNPGLDPAHMPEGMSLNIRKKDQGDTTGWQIAEQMEEYRDAINNFTTDGQYYIVKSGDTLYSLAKNFQVSIEEITAANDIKDGLKAGQLIKIPGKSIAETNPEKPEPAFDSRKDSIEYVWKQIKTERTASESENIICDISSRNYLNISLLLPLTDENGMPAKDKDNFVQFYQGMLVGLEDLKNQGVNANLTVFDTSRSLGTTDDIINSERFRQTDLVIGPVYEEGLLPVIAFAENKGIPVVSPLQQLNNVSSPVLYQMAPSASHKYDKIKTLLAQPGLNIIYITTSVPDTDMDANLRPVLPLHTKELQYTGSGFTAALERNLDKRNDNNIIIVSCTNMQIVNQILYSSLSAQSQTNSKLNVVGNAGWARFPAGSVDHELYFKLRLSFVTNYYADHNDQRVSYFNKRYMENFSALPSPFSYRGYDAVKLFAGALMTDGKDFTRKINNSNQILLQMPYRFERTETDDDFRNIDWVLVCYGSDYTIRIE